MLTYPIIFREATITLLDLYNLDNALFDELQIPEKLDKDILTNNLLLRYGSLEPIYSNPSDLKTMIGFWAKRRVIIWNRLLATTEYEYNPIENSNRYEDIDDTSKKTNTGTDTDVKQGTVKDTGTDNRELANNGTTTLNKGTSSETSGNYTDTTETTDSATGYNSDELKVVTNNKVESKGNSTFTTTDSGKDETTIENTGHDNRTVDLSHEDNTTNTKTLDLSEDSTYKRKAHLHGNIGVTTTQQMIEQERNIVKFDMYNYIITDFVENFLTLVY